MKKYVLRIISFFLCCALLLGHAPLLEKTFAESGYLEATSADWKTLEEDLDIILTFNGFYDYKLCNSYENILTVNATDLIHSHYFDSNAEYSYGDDPLGYFENDEYYVIDATEIDWIVSNVFNQTPNHDLITNKRYYYNGKYYSVFYASSCPIIETGVVNYEKNADNSYKIYLEEKVYVDEVYETDEETYFTNEYLVEAYLKNVNGKRTWSFLYFGPEKTIRNIYEKLIDDFYSEYYVYDIDGDGTTELIVFDDDKYDFIFYDYQKGQVTKIGTCHANSRSLTRVYGQRNLYTSNYIDGKMVISLITKENGKIKITDIDSMPDGVSATLSYYKFDDLSGLDLCTVANEDEPSDDVLLEDPLITRVKQYAFDSEDEFYHKLEEFAESNDVNDYNELVSIYNMYGDSRKEMYDFLSLTNNELYVSWQFKEMVGKPFAKFGLGAARIVYSGDLWQYVAGNNPYEQRYETAFRKFVEENASDVEFLNYQNLWYNLLSQKEVANEFESFSVDVSKALTTIMEATTETQLENILKELELDKIFMNIDAVELKKVLPDTSLFLNILGTTVKIRNLATESVCKMFKLIAKSDAYKEYSSLFNKVANAKTLPDALRNAACTVSYDIDEQIKSISDDLLEGISAELAETATGIWLDATLFTSNGFLGSVAGGISIGAFISNAALGFTDTMNAVCYIEAYAMIGEFYAEELIKLKKSFNNNPTLKKAQEFKKDYEFLRCMRIAGEKAYLEMQKHENMQTSLFKLVIIALCNYYKKAVFVNKSVEELESMQFAMTNDYFEPRSYVEDVRGKITVACPVDIYIYDENGNLVCSVENNTVSYFDDTTYTLPKVLTVEDTKHIFIPQNSDYHIEIKAYDSGTMSCSVDSFYGESCSKSNYFDVPISTGDIFVLNEEHSGDYGTLTKDGIFVDDDEFYYGDYELRPSVTVKAKALGLGYVSSGDEYAKGDMIGLVATPKNGSEFQYWLINGQRVDGEQEMYFVARESLEAVAVFSSEDKIDIVSPQNDIIKYGETLILSSRLSNIATEAKIHWIADSDVVVLAPSADGKTCAVKSMKTGNVRITACLVDDNGNVIFDKEAEKSESSLEIVSKAGLFQKIISFFKNFFKMNRIIY